MSSEKSKRRPMTSIRRYKIVLDAVKAANIGHDAPVGELLSILERAALEEMMGK